MDQKNVNIVELENSIGKLGEILTQLCGVNTNICTVAGSGIPIDILSAIDEEYGNVKQAMISLVSNSILYFNQIKEDFLAADEAAASMLDGGM